MDYDNVADFIRDLNGPNASIERHGDWIMTNCVLAPWTHTKGTDTKPSFGITDNPGEESIFHCLTCKRKGHLGHLLDLLEDFSGDDYDHLREGLGKAEFLSNSLPTWEHKRGYKKKDKLKPLVDEYKYIYESATGHPYLKKRGISDTAASTMELLVDPDDGHNDERILFPVRGIDGLLYGYTGRAVKDKVNPKVKDYLGLKKRQLLLGAHLIKPQHKYVIVVEGLFDYANLVQYGYPVVALLHSGLTKDQRTVLLEFMKPVIPMLDNDMAGREGIDAIVNELDGALPLYTITYPPFTRRWYKKRKWGADPGNLRKRSIKWMLDNKELL